MLFKEKVVKAFEYLLTNFNFKISENGNKGIATYVKFHSQKCDVIVYSEGWMVEVLIIALIDIPGLKAGMSREFELRHILNHIAPELDFNYNKKINNQDDIEKELERLADYLLKYCRLIIEGDFSIWPELNKKWS